MRLKETAAFLSRALYFTQVALFHAPGYTLYMEVIYK